MNYFYYITLSIIGIIAFAYLFACTYLYFFQRKILYLPVKEMAMPHNYGLHGLKQVKLTTKDNVQIVAWYKPPQKGQPVILYFHGNAGNLGDRLQKLGYLLELNTGMLIVSYRGYGGSKGTPSEEGLYSDGRAAMDHLHKVTKTPLKDIIIYGESLGSGVATKMATEYKIGLLVLEAPYTSIAHRAKELYPFFPVNLLLKDHFNSIDNLKDIHVPLLIFHGYQDEVTPISHGRKILMAANEPKEAHFYEEAGHTDFDYQEVAKITGEFIKQHLK